MHNCCHNNGSRGCMSTHILIITLPNPLKENPEP